METITEWKTLTLETLSSMLKNMASVLPKIIGALAILILGWIITKVVLLVLRRILRVARVGKISERINATGLFGEGSKVKINIEKILLVFVKAILFLLFIIVAADVVGLNVISEEIAKLLRYAPVFLSAISIFMIGMYAAELVKNTLASIFETLEFNGAKLLSNIVYYILGIFVLITSLNQAGVDTTIITNNFTLVLGAFLLAFALAFGLGSKEVIGNVLKTFYVRKNYAVGDIIKVQDIEGAIVAIDNISLTIKTKKGKIVIPIKEIADNRVEIK
ncbi:mechanosensitive ion channel family protein [Spongiimicrobium sp. 3-5]|uniref:mechanosensitive ion channel family protein n=1 Tax=Spongiimicrobium sp. 3-5 TaxID=3332596 RepID=UPI00398004FE